MHDRELAFFHDLLSLGIAPHVATGIASTETIDSLDEIPTNINRLCEIEDVTVEWAIELVEAAGEEPVA